MAFGACVQAAVLKRKTGTSSIYVRNVTPQTIGVVCASKDFPCFPIIKRNTEYPTDAHIIGRTATNNQVKIRLVLFEGEQRIPSENVTLGEMILHGIEASPKGQEIIDITLKIDDYGGIYADAIDRKTKKDVKMKIEREMQFDAMKSRN